LDHSRLHLNICLRHKSAKIQKVVRTSTWQPNNGLAQARLPIPAKGDCWKILLGSDLIPFKASSFAGETPGV